MRKFMLLTSLALFIISCESDDELQKNQVLKSESHFEKTESSKFNEIDLENLQLSEKGKEDTISDIDIIHWRN